MAFILHYLTGHRNKACNKTSRIGSVIKWVIVVAVFLLTLAWTPTTANSRLLSNFYQDVIAETQLGIASIPMSLTSPRPAPTVRSYVENRGTIKKIISAPISTDSRIVSGYGYRTGRTKKSKTFHAGIDFDATRGAPVYSVRPGIIEVVYHDQDPSSKLIGYGNSVVVFHEDEDIWVLYAHLDSVAVKEGDSVQAGQVIGRAGNTSNGRFSGMGVHLHLEIRKRSQSGQPPFPGGYGLNDRNPLHWLQKHGIKYDHYGYFIEIEKP